MPTAITPHGDTMGYLYEAMYDDDPTLDGALARPYRGLFRDRDGAMIELKMPGAT